MKEFSWKRTFFTIWSGQAVSLLTSSIVQCAIIWHLTATTLSPVVLSAAALVGFLPQGLLGPFVGVYVDRWNRKTIMIISDTCIAAACLVIVIVGLFMDLPVWLFMVVLLIRSVGSAFHSPSLAAVTPQIVPQEQLTRCAGYSQTLQSVSLVLSPALAAMLYAVWSLESIIFLDVIGALVGVGTLAVCKIPRLKNPRTDRPHVLRECMEGLRVLHSHKGMVGLLIISSLYFVAFTPVSALYPLMVMDYLGGGTAEAGVVEVVFSVGMLAGSLLLGAWGGFKNRVWSIAASMLVTGLALVLAGVLPPTGLLAFTVLTAFMGFGMPFGSGCSMALFQEKIEPEYLGRVMSLSTSVMVLATPIGIALSGASADIIGVHRWFVIAGIGVLICGALYMIIPSVRRCGE